MAQKTSNMAIFGSSGPPKMPPGPLVGMMEIAKWLSLIKGVGGGVKGIYLAILLN